MISWISKTFSSVKITPENNAISIDNQQIKLLNPYQKREHRTGHPIYFRIFLMVVGCLRIETY